MADGVERRAQIDTETVKALLLINGGGTIALLALLPSLITRGGHTTLVRAILFGVLVLVLGLASAVVHNRLRRKCSLCYEQHQMKPPPAILFGRRLSEPMVCVLSTMFMWASIAAFVGAGIFVAFTGLLMDWPPLQPVPGLPTK